MKTARLLFILIGCLSMPAQASNQAAELQQIRLQGFALINNLLAYYNPNSDGVDPRFQDRYQAARAQLIQVVPAQGELREALENLLQYLAEFEAEAGETPAYLYAHWFNPMLKAHAALDRLADQRYQMQAVAGNVAKQHELNLKLSKLLLLYQTRTFGIGTLGVFAVEMDENAFKDLDASITKGFSKIIEDAPGLTDSVERLANQYAFVRPRLLDHSQKWVPGITAYYMGNISQDLAALAP
ncbi:hypothetical protein MD273_17220 [Marinobacter pelagius]|uniref:hypothetical protein n=1 Tax=Marinobacter sp. C7 TaxID=2951363 RepID=UPI001EF01E9B|nr:hypothetical protein [Marinobacter sp. C7]MCG7201481.1 hypothetical protein [Marinobacter sp. C7]